MKMRRVLCAAFMFFAARELCVMAFMNEYGDIAVLSGVKMYPTIWSNRGYAMRRFKIENRSLDQTYRVTLSIPADRFVGRASPAPRLHTVSKTIDVEPSTMEYVTVFQPAVSMFGYDCAVTIDGQRQEQPVEMLTDLYRFHAAPISALTTSATTQFVSSPDPYEPKIFMTNINAAAYQATMSNKASEYLSRSTAGGKKLAHPVFISANSFENRFNFMLSRKAGKFTAGNSSKISWLHYSPLEGVVYDDSYVNEMTDQARLALWRYVECGGTLTFIVIRDGVEVGDGTSRYSSKKLLSEWASLDSRLKNRRVYKDTYERFDVGFGVFHLVGRDSFGSVDIADTGVAVPETWYEARAAWHRQHTAYGANQVLPMTEPVDSRGSFQRFFFLAFFLAVLIGPAHLYVLKRMKRRGWVYWTTPALAALACGAFVLYASVAFGWNPQTRVVSLTHLDQQTGRAATIGWAAYYSPMTNAAELHFDENTELTPLVYGDQLVGSIDWTDGQRLTGGWLPARVPRHFKLRKNEDRPERIDIKREGGALKVVNRLGARVKHFWYADHDGTLYRASGIGNGAEAALTKTTGAPIGSKKLRDVYASQDWVDEIEAVKAKPAAYLQPGQYFAELKENVFVEKALKGAKAKPSISLVLGTLE